MLHHFVCWYVKCVKKVPFRKSGHICFHFSVHGMCSVCFSLCVHKIIMMKVVIVTEKAMGNPTLLHQVIFSVKVVPHENISNSSNTGRSALPDMYAHARGRVHTYQGNARLPVLQLICYTLINHLTAKFVEASNLLLKCYNLHTTPYNPIKLYINLFTIEQGIRLSSC